MHLNSFSVILCFIQHMKVKRIKSLTAEQLFPLRSCRNKLNQTEAPQAAGGSSHQQEALLAHTKPSHTQTPPQRPAEGPQSLTAAGWRVKLYHFCCLMKIND